MNIRSALNAIDCASLDYSEWLAVGMALKAEGYDVGAWDDFSRSDPKRYKPGECARKWESFTSTSNDGVTGGTIIKLAQDRGWTPFDGDGAMDWDDVIEYDGSDTPPKAELTPVEQLERYINALYEPDDIVSYVVEAQFDSRDNKWKPQGWGEFKRTAADILASLGKHPDDINWTIGDYNTAAGAWIRFNPLDGEGVNKNNVTAFRFALVECDGITVQEQMREYQKLQLPVAALVLSGGKSAHAIVHIDASNLEEYRRRVQFLYAELAKRGVVVDQNNKNPNRLSRMPGVTRGDQVQKLVGVNMGRANWASWENYIKGEERPLPSVEWGADLAREAPEMAEPIIEGVLRRGHKMLYSSTSKGGKSFSLIQLAEALSTGGEWLEFRCKPSNVLYLNFEIDRASFYNRMVNVCGAMGLTLDEVMKRFWVWNLRGVTLTLDNLASTIIEQAVRVRADAIIIDPIYKVMLGDENSASDMAKFCNQFDRIAEGTGAAVIYCHHHSKGAQGAKKAQDRMSGSGVFARDPDAVLDVTELELPDTIRARYADSGERAFRMEGVLREFASFKPVDLWWEWPVMRVDKSGVLAQLGTEGSSIGNLGKSARFTVEAERRESVEAAYEAMMMNGPPVKVADMAEYSGVTAKTMRNRIVEHGGFSVTNGLVFRSKE